MLLTFTTLIVTILLFIWGKPRADITALLSLLALYVGGVLSIGQALSGFGDPTVILIAALFVVGEGLSQTGITSWLGAKMLALSARRPLRLLLWMMGIAGLLSGVMSNTGAVAALMPAVVAAAWGVGSVPARFLMPLSFAAITGGMLTLTGTPPNVVVAETLRSADFTPFGFFEFALIGGPMLLLVMLYMATLGQRVLPSHTSGVRPIDIHTSLGELADSYSLHGKLFRLRIRRQSQLDGMTLAQSGLGRDYEISVLRIERASAAADSGENGGTARPQARGVGNSGAGLRQSLERLLNVDDLELPTGSTRLQADDVLLARATPEIIQRAQVNFNFGVQPVDEDAEPLAGTLLSREIGLAEVLVTPRSEYIGQTLAGSRFADQFGVHVIGVRRHDQVAKRQRVQLDFGDSLLVRGAWEAISRLAEDRRNFVVVGSPDAMAGQVPTLSRQAWIALGALALMVGLMVTGAVPSVVAALFAAVLMMLAQIVPPDQAYRAINWPSIVLIAGMIPMSVALEESGGATFLVSLLVNVLGGYSPLILLSGIFLVTSILSQVISNTATTVLVAPLALQAALSLEVSPYPLLMMVAVGASTAFLTPIGTPTNLLVMAPGGYQFRHYAAVGLPLFLLFWGVSLLLVPLIWPL